MRSTDSLRFFTFRTRLGWIGVAGRKNSLSALSFGHSSEDAARKRLILALDQAMDESDWNRTFRQRLVDYAEGAPIDFLDIEVVIENQTPFAASVVDACRRVPYGETRSYGDLARDVGADRAARAVGNVMRTNRCPLVVPCHRVVHGDGRIGQFSAPQGVSMKQRLLAMEAASHGITRKQVVLV
jgi:methylated-DNA-[protein]-cysteine S-methyltransferase